MHAQWKAARIYLKAPCNLAQWNVIVGSALLQYQVEFKEHVADVRSTLQGYHDNHVQFTTEEEKKALQQTKDLRTWCQD